MSKIDYIRGKNDFVEISQITGYRLKNNFIGNHQNNVEN